VKRLKANETAFNKGALPKQMEIVLLEHAL